MLFANNDVVHQALGPAYREDERSTWSQLSFGLSLAGGAMMVLQHEALRGGAYERVLFARTDIVLITDFAFHGPSTPALTNVVFTECCLPSPRFPNGFGDQLLLAGPAGVRVIAGFALRNAAAREHRGIAKHMWIHQRLNESGMVLRQMNVVQGWDALPYRRVGERHACVNALGAPFFAKYGMLEAEARRVGLDGKPRITWQQRMAIYSNFSRENYECTEDGCYTHGAQRCYCVHRKGWPHTPEAQREMAIVLNPCRRRVGNASNIN